MLLRAYANRAMLLSAYANRAMLLSTYANRAMLRLKYCSKNERFNYHLYIANVTDCVALLSTV